VEGTSDRHEPFTVTGRWSRRSRRLPHDGASDDAKASKRRIRKLIRPLRGRGRGDRGVRGSIAKQTPGTVGRKRPRSQQIDHREVTDETRGRPEKQIGAGWCLGAIHRSGCGRRESPLPPAILFGAQDSVGCPRGESRDSGSGTHEVRVHAVRLGGRSRSDASSVLSAGRLQGLVAREGASQKEARTTA
jgi:hypothetical protein